MFKRLARLLRQSPAMVVALLALFVALSGTAVATTSALITGKQIADSSISGADVRNKSLTPADFRGSVRGPRGERGLRGEQGEEGVEGESGEDGDDGEDGEDGTDAAINGVAAGGDLAGTFPNPTLRAMPAARVFNDAGQMIAAGDRVRLASENYLRGMTHSTGTCDTPPSGDCFLIVERAGIYLITGTVTWATQSGARTLELNRYPTLLLLARDSREAAPGTQTSQTVTSVAQLAVGQAVGMSALQDTLGSLNLESATLTATWLGP